MIYIWFENINKRRGLLLPTQQGGLPHGALCIPPLLTPETAQGQCMNHKTSPQDAISTTHHERGQILKERKESQSFLCMMNRLGGQGLLLQAREKLSAVKGTIRQRVELAKQGIGHRKADICMHACVPIQRRKRKINHYGSQVYGYEISLHFVFSLKAIYYVAACQTNFVCNKHPFPFPVPLPPSVSLFILYIVRTPVKSTRGWRSFFSPNMNIRERE